MCSAVQLSIAKFKAAASPTLVKRQVVMKTFSDFCHSQERSNSVLYGYK